MTGRWLIALIAVMMTIIIGQAVAAAQQKSVVPAPATLAVELVDDNMAVLQAPVLETPEGGFLETSRFRKLSDRKQTVGAAPVTSLRIRALMEGEAVRIKVYVVFDDSEPVESPGPKYGAREQPVGSYLAREGETVSVRELNGFGIEPLLLRVVRAQLRVEEQPLAVNAEIENALKSVEVVSFTPLASSPRWYRLSLRNLTRKGIIALEIYESEQGRRGSGSQTAMQATPGHPVIPPGAVYETKVSVSGSRDRMTPQGFAPDPQQQLTLVIGTLVFDDGTYEGEAEVAANIEARQLGRRLQIKRVLSLLKEISDAQDAATALEKLKSQAAALRIDADAATVNKLLTRYPSLSEEYQKKRLTAEIMNGFRSGREEVLHKIVEFEQSEGKIDFSTWLARMKEQYEAMTEPVE